MIHFFNSPAMKNAMNKILLIFIFYVVAAASFNGLFVVNAFMDSHDPRRSFQAMYDDTAYKPFIYRQLMMETAKKIREILPEETQTSLTQEFKNIDLIKRQYARAKIEERFVIEYHILYFMCLGCIFLSMFLWRQIGIEITGSKYVGTITACAFAIIFPMFEWLWVYYDCGEILFCSAAVLLAIRGNWLVIILISPIAAYNKE